MQNLVVIGRAHLKPEHCQMWSNFEFDRNLVSGTGARRCQYCINKTKLNRQCACFKELLYITDYHTDTEAKWLLFCRDIFFSCVKIQRKWSPYFRIFSNKKVCILIEISLKFVPKGPTDHSFRWIGYEKAILFIHHLLFVFQYLFCIYSFAQKNKEKRRDVLLSVYVFLFVYLFSTLLLFRLIRQLFSENNPQLSDYCKHKLYPSRH